jgi:endonuclease/exonuclease/phosphatase family metal-dependent hydrolase
MKSIDTSASHNKLLMPLPRMPIAAAILLMLLGLYTPSYGQSTPATFTLCSFNIRIFSNGSRDDAELALIADRLQQCDLVAIQEVRDAIVVRRVENILEERGHVFDSITSDPVGRGVQERYTFLWRPSLITPIGEAVIWPDATDSFIREPFIASFRAGQFDFSLITMHSIFGDSKTDRRAEAALLDDVYRTIQNADDNEQDVIVLGDFNLPPEDPGFQELLSLLTPLFTGNRYTTISENAKSLYDNIWFDPEHLSEYTGDYGMDDFDVTVFGNDDRAASLAVSDHRPIWARFRIDLPDDDGDGATAATAPSWAKIKRGSATPPTPIVRKVPKSVSSLIDVNSASQAALESLPGIGPVIAARIIAGRPYRRIDDLIRVKGIGPKRLAQIRTLVSVE